MAQQAYLNPRVNEACPEFAPGFVPSYKQCQLVFCLNLERTLSPKQIWLAVIGHPGVLEPIAKYVDEYYSAREFMGNEDELADRYLRWRQDYIRCMRHDENGNWNETAFYGDIPVFEFDTTQNSTSRRIYSEFRLNLLKAMEKDPSQRAKLCQWLCSFRYRKLLSCTEQVLDNIFERAGETLVPTKHIFRRQNHEAINAWYNEQEIELHKAYSVPYLTGNDQVYFDDPDTLTQEQSATSKQLNMAQQLNYCV